MSASSVSVLIGSESFTAFLAIAQDTAHDRFLQLFARVLGFARDGQTCLFNCAVRSAKERGLRPAQMTDSQLPVGIRPFQRRRLRNVRQQRTRVDPFKNVHTRQAFQVPHNQKPHLMMRPSLAPTRTTTIARNAACDSLTCAASSNRGSPTSDAHRRSKMLIATRDALHE